MQKHHEKRKKVFSLSKFCCSLVKWVSHVVILLWIAQCIPYLGYDAAEVSTLLGKAEQAADGRLRDVQTARELYLPQQVLGDTGQKSCRSQTDNAH